MHNKGAGPVGTCKCWVRVPSCGDNPVELSAGKKLKNFQMRLLLELDELILLVYDTLYSLATEIEALVDLLGAVG